MEILRSTKLYKYLEYSNDSLKIITEGTIKFSDPTKFNDPFDCLPCYDPSKADHVVNTRPDLMLAAANFRGLSLEKLMKENPKQRLANALESGQYSFDLASSVGVCSLSRDPLNLLMWAHYADKHKGFVVEFRIPEEATEPFKTETQSFEFLVPQKVVYKQNRPIVLPTDSEDEKLNKQYLTKGLPWQYEQEERVIDWIRKSGIHKYDQKTILSSIITGLKMNSKHVKDIKEKVITLNKKYKMSVSVHAIATRKNKSEIYVPDRPDIKSPQP
jgi:hypothetical protein